MSGCRASVGVDVTDDETRSIALLDRQLAAAGAVEVPSPQWFLARAAEFQPRLGFAEGLE